MNFNLRKKERPPKAEQPAPAERAARKQEARTLRRSRGMNIARVMLWIILAFLFLRGVASILQPGTNPNLDALRQELQAELGGAQDVQALAFAQSFAWEYLSYTNGGEADYQQRLSQYAVPAVANSNVRLRGGSAQVLYASAYRLDAYSETQMDVWVLLQVRYTTQTVNPETGGATETATVEQTTLKIPVAVSQTGCIVEDFPVFVTDSRKMPDYQRETYTGTQAGREEATAIEEALGNFFRAYYEGEQSVVRYYLAGDADLDDFAGLQGRILFQRITACKVYTETAPEEYLAIVTLSASDRNDITLEQSYHLRLLRQGGQYYVRSLDVRSANLNQT